MLWGVCDEQERHEAFFGRKKAPYCSRDGWRAGAAGPGVQGVVAGNVPDGRGHGAELGPALLRLQWLREIHSTEH